MLQALQIENYALIRSLKINFDKGFTVITGETGAGKSIIIGALSLILGKRADTSVLHDKSRKCFIEGTFDISKLKLQDFFQQHDLDYQDITYIRREVTENGKSRAFVNDTPVNLTVLKELAESLVDIHSQHNNLLVNNGNFRIDLLDQYAQNAQLLTQYQELYSAYKKAEKRHQELTALQQQQAQEQSYLTYVVQELSEARLNSGEQENIEQQIALLSHAETIKSKLYQSVQLLEEEEEENILHRLQVIQDNCHNISTYDKDLEELSQRIDSSQLELKDITREVARAHSCVVALTGAVDIVTDGTRLATIHNGTPLQARLTGMGCATTALVGAWAAATTDMLVAAAGGVLSMGIAGDIARERAGHIGLGTFHSAILDALGNLDETTLQESAKLHEN